VGLKPLKSVFKDIIEELIVVNKTIIIEGNKSWESSFGAGLRVAGDEENVIKDD
jgi:hypothetical protein